MKDNREDLYDVNGNYVGQGGQGMVTRPGVDPSGGAHQQVVKTGIQKMEDDVAQVQNGVTDVAAPKSVLSGWNYAKRGAIQPVQAQPVQQVSVSANGNVDTVVTPPTDTKQSDSVTTPSVGSTAKSPALQELRQRQKAEIDAENAKKTEEAIKREDADKPLANGGQPKVDETQLQSEKKANPQSSETGDGRDGVTAQNTDAGDVASPTDPKFTTGDSAGMNTVSDEDYTSAQQRIADAKKSGKIPEQKDEETVWLHDNPRPVQPEMPALEEFTASQPPKLKDIDDSYRTAYAIMQERIKAAGDDPESKAKRSKARRAQTLVAALGDLLQAAANMWGAAKGATSAKLSSISAGVARRHAAEDTAELKREAQRAKDLEQMVRRGEKLTDAENKKIMELWKAGENARKYNISEKNKAILSEYGKRNEAWGKDYASWLRRFEKIGKDNASARREANTFARQKAMEDYRQANREKNQATSHRNALARKQAPSYSDLHKGSGTADTPLGKK